MTHAQTLERRAIVMDYSFNENFRSFYETWAKLIQSLRMISADDKNIFVHQENSAED